MRIALYRPPAARSLLSALAVIALMATLPVIGGCEGLFYELDELEEPIIGDNDDNDDNNDSQNNNGGDDACESDVECDDGKHCIDGECVAPCHDADCVGDETCYQGECFARCDEDHRCGDGYRCMEGVCVPRNCDAADYCPDGTTCYQGGCYEPCDGPGDCADGDECHNDRVCLQPACDDGLATGTQTDVDCGGDKCAPCGDGLRCESDGDCQGRYCDVDNTCRTCDPEGNPFDMGDDDTPHLICNADQFARLPLQSGKRDKNFVVVDDIDMNDTNETFNAFSDHAVAAYTGTFDGRGHTVENLSIDGVDPTHPVGIFGTVGDGGAIKNLTFASLTVMIDNEDDDDPPPTGGVVGRAEAGSEIANVKVDEFSSIEGPVTTGGLVGHVEKDAQVLNSRSRADVDGGDRTGGLVGFNQGTIEQSYADGEIIGIFRVGGLVGESLYGGIDQCFALGGVTADDVAGGLIGQSDGDEISDSYSLASISSSEGADLVVRGGLVGSAENTDVARCYAAGDVSDSGGLFGQAASGEDAPTISQSYFDSDEISTPPNMGDDDLYGDPMETEEFQEEDNFDDWDFNDPDPVWTIETFNDGYARPQLTWTQSQ